MCTYQVFLKSLKTKKQSGFYVMFRRIIHIQADCPLEGHKACLHVHVQYCMYRYSELLDNIDRYNGIASETIVHRN